MCIIIVHHNNYDCKLQSVKTTHNKHADIVHVGVATTISDVNLKFKTAQITTVSSRFCQKWGFEVGNGIEPFYVGMCVYMSHQKLSCLFNRFNYEFVCEDMICIHV